MAAEPAQSRPEFLSGCGLPQAWAGQPQWLILETSFGLGLHFLTTWHAWRSDPERPRMLHFVSIDARPVSAAALLRAAQAQPELASLAAELIAQWHGLLPGFHRLAFDDGRVLLTLCVGDTQAMLRAQRFEADSIFLTDPGPGPQDDPALWSPETLKAVSRFARQGTAMVSGSTAEPVRDALRQFGFTLDDGGDHLRGVFAPAWTVRRREPAPERIDTPGRCAVLGAGLAGAAVAASLARRGWQVTVLDGADQPAAGASGLPVGMLAPHVSPDDALLSRLTRAGIRATWSELTRLLEEGRDWRASGVLERRPDGDTRVPPGWTDSGPNESWPATAAQRGDAGLPADAPALWHARAAWVRPHQLIAAWLRQPGIAFRGGCRVARMAHADGGWQLFGPSGELLAEADRVVVCAGFESGDFAPTLPLQPVRGQVAWGRMRDGIDLPATPINGDGHLIAHVPHGEAPPIWLAGATFDRDSTNLSPTAADSDANRDRLARLHPGAARALAHAQVDTWVGIRCASGDRRPLVGPLDGDAPGLWACTALGSRGLSFAALCAELLAAQWHGEPLALPAALAKAVGTQRLRPGR
ncbi:FAD-dependent 5-carboxymethylaminomethyl-2-thiouridine(34) oxidoreductase MnmC [Variovorax sp. H27-G14]|uniref:FAD-dependent 5-carboxymethylaminomethyl-2-thiouridine(34) oxidoreductase MnmC n=1 Tax=Variovorax sp. H27-G14 TaxID=3111914 RepID=UPI0038FC132E